MPKFRPPKKKKPPQNPPLHGGSFTIKYGSAEMLAKIGPTIKATWRVPAERLDALKDAGLPVPQPVVGEMLVDTGASATCIAEDAALELGLQAVDLEEHYGAGGKHKSTIYAATILISIVKDDGTTSYMEGTIRAAGIPHLRDYFDNKQVKQGGNPVRMVGLLGRDLLRLSRMNYQGTKGVVNYTFDFSSLVKP
jgi:hypothetical protein